MEDAAVSLASGGELPCQPDPDDEVLQRFAWSDIGAQRTELMLQI